VLQLETDVLLIGAGVASARCARTLRREGFDGRIMLVGDEPMLPYNRPPLSKELLRDALPDDLVLAEPETWYARRNIDLLLGRRVAAIDADTRTATLDDGTGTGFERCLIATGAEPRHLPVPGGEHALLLRTLADARRLRAAAVEAGAGAPVTVVGGGFIGLEVASSLASLGLRPTVLELGDRLWSGSLGRELSDWATDALAGIGVGVRLGAGVTRLEPDAAWVGDERVEAAFVIAGIGVRPRLALAEAGGLETNDGIVTDASHRTSHPSIWAAGDVARRAGMRIEHWHAAREGGERAARAMLGLEVGPDPAPWVFSEVGGHALDVIGVVEPWTDERWVREGVLVYADGDRLIGVAIVDGAMPVEDAREAVVVGSAAKFAPQAR
jgi:3-phenylpropionate/trans-cinnamate dioxygenase ferredoxin reductase component